MTGNMKNLVSTDQLDKKIILKLFKDADEQRSFPSVMKHPRIMATLFYEPSTRTRLSFESAMLRLGGQVISSDSNSNSSIKGESLQDTVTIISEYADIIVLRHPKNGIFNSLKSRSILINAGEGSDSHPSQTLVDLYEIYRKFNRIDGLKVAVVDDGYSRTTKSLYKAMQMFDVNFISVHPELLSNKLIENFKPDVMYLTRPQVERGSKLSYTFTSKHMSLMPEHSIVLHPLPRTCELSEELDKDKRSCWFSQAAGGLYMRMAIINYLLH